MIKNPVGPRKNIQIARFFNPVSATQRVAVAVSACLTGEKVRYDGGDKRLTTHSLLNEELLLIPICPEVGAGLGVPRPPVELIANDGSIRARGRDNPQLDVTSKLQHFAAQSLIQLSSQYSLCGYLWKSRSPSCGFGSTPFFDANGNELGRTDGIQAKYFREHLSYIAYCEESTLQTEHSALGFVLRCRLVFDVLHAPNAPLKTIHRHYAFLLEHNDEQDATALLTILAMNDRKKYLAALLEACDQISADALLNLFLK